MKKSIVNYENAVKEIKCTILRSRYVAARLANKELLNLYFAVGRYVSENSRNGFWGTGAIATISKRLSQELPGLRGFSEGNIKKMRLFYEAWKPFFEIRSLGTNDFQMVPANRSLEMNDLNAELFFSVGFTNHCIIVMNIKKFIMALGNDFAFIGNQYKVVVSGKEYFIDLLFFNRRLQSLVAIELKKGEFKPEYAGKLNFYLSALDEYVKLPMENPSIGIVLCKSKDKNVVEFSFRDTTKPMGVAGFKTSNKLPKEYKNILPAPEDLKKQLG